jgi:hypothetical protein
MGSHDIMDDTFSWGGIQPSHKSGHDILHTMWQPCKVKLVWLKPIAPS